MYREKRKENDDDDETKEKKKQKRMNSVVQVLTSRAFSLFRFASAKV